MVGSVTGHRYWSSMLHPEGTVTCGAWSPDDQQVCFLLISNNYSINILILYFTKVYFGTSRGQMKVLDINGVLIFQVNLLSQEKGISSMSWSCEKFFMNENRNKSDSK